MYTFQHVVFALATGAGSGSALCAAYRRTRLADQRVFLVRTICEAIRLAGEMREQKRTLPRALLFGVLCATAIYMMTTLVLIYLVPQSAATSAPEFARLAGKALLGSSGPAVRPSPWQ